MRWLVCLFLALASTCFAQDQIFADAFDGRPTQWGCHPVRNNMGVSFAPPQGGSDLKMRMEVQALPVRKGEELFGALVGQGGTAPYAFSIISGSLPSGISLATDGTLSGTPDTVEYAQFIAQVQDSALGEYKCTFAINVIPPFVVVAGDPPDAEHNYYYPVSTTPTAGYQFRVSGQTGVLTWSISSGTLPTDVVLDSSTGILSDNGGGISASVGDKNFTVRATDGGSGDFIDIPCIVHVYSELKTRPSPANVTLVVGVEKTISQNSFGFQGGASPFSYDLSDITWPDGLTVTPNADGTATILATEAFGKTNYSGGTVTDSLGAVLTGPVDVNFTAVSAIQPQQSGVDVGAVGMSHLNFVGADVDNTDGVTTVTISGSGSTVTADGDFIQSTPTTSGDPEFSLTPSQRSYYGTASPTSSGPNDYHGTMTPTPASYEAGSTFRVTFSSANTGAATLSLDALPAKAIQLRGSALTGGEIPANSTLALQYDGVSAFEIVGGGTGVSSLTTTGNTGPATLTGGALNIPQPQAFATYFA